MFLDFSATGTTGYLAISALYMPPMQFLWLGVSYDPASQMLELFRYGGGYELVGDTYRKARVQAPPERLARKLGMGWGGTNNPSAQVSAAMWWEHRLTYEEMVLVATAFKPAVFQYGRFPFHYTDVPRTCPSGGASFPFTLYLPHTYGGAVTVTMSASAGGSFTPAFLRWDTPTTAERNRKVGMTFQCFCAPSGTTTFSLALSGDTARYSLPKTSFQVTKLDPSAVAVFRLNVAASAPTAATKDATYKTISFDGWSQYLSEWKTNQHKRCKIMAWPASAHPLSFFFAVFFFLSFFRSSLCPDLNTLSDSGKAPTGTPALNIPPYLMYAAEDDWEPERVGFSVEGWYQPLSWHHAHTLFSNGPTEASYMVRCRRRCATWGQVREKGSGLVAVGMHSGRLR